MQPTTANLSTASLDNNRRKFLIAALNGTTLYVLAYYLVWGLHQVAMLQVSRHYHLRGSWTPSTIVFTLSDGEWWRMAIITVNGVGPLVCLLVGLGAFYWFWKSERAQRGQFKLFLIWVAFHSCNAVFGALLADSLTQSGFWYVPDWLLQLGNVVNMLLAVMAGLIQLGLGYIAAVPFLQAHDSKTVMRFQNRRLMVSTTLIIPWVLGSVFVALTKFSYFSMHEALHLVVMGLLVAPTALGCLSEVFSDTVRRPQPTHVAWGLVGLAVIVAMAWRLLLSPPLAFR